MDKLNGVMEGAREQGLEPGKEQDRLEGKFQVAEELLRDGIAFDVIMRCTGFSKDQLEEIRKKLSATAE